MPIWSRSLPARVGRLLIGHGLVAAIRQSFIARLGIAVLLFHAVFFSVLFLRKLSGAIDQLTHLAGGVVLLHSPQRLTRVAKSLRGLTGFRLRRGIALLALRRSLIRSLHGFLGLLHLLHDLIQSLLQLPRAMLALAVRPC